MFLSRDYRLVVALRKFDVLEHNIIKSNKSSTLAFNIRALTCPRARLTAKKKHLVWLIVRYSLIIEIDSNLPPSRALFDLAKTKFTENALKESCLMSYITVLRLYIYKQKYDRCLVLKCT